MRFETVENLGSADASLAVSPESCTVFAINGYIEMAKVACIQTNSGPDVAANLAAAERMIRSAHAEGCKLMAMPEVVDFRDDGAEPIRPTRRCRTRTKPLRSFPRWRPNCRSGFSRGR